MLVWSPADGDVRISSFTMRKLIKSISHTIGLQKPAAIIQESRRNLLRSMDRYDSTFSVREGLQFRIDNAARRPFSMFVSQHPDMINEMDRFIELSREKNCLMDVGSLYGIFSLVFTAIDPTKSAHAIEPSPKALKVLRKSLSLNNQLNLQIHPIALGNEKKLIPMHYEWTHYIASHSGKERSNLVQMTTLDEVVQDMDTKPDILKIDVDGYEGAVLSGGTSFLAANKPLLFLELHGEWIERYGYQPEQLFYLLRDLGYNFFNLNKDPINDPLEQFSIFANRIICSPKLSLD